MASLLLPGEVSADGALATADATLGARTVQVSVQGTVGGAGAIVLSEPPTRVPVDGPLPGAGSISIRTVAVTGGSVVHVKIGADPTATEAVVALRRGAPAFVWSGRTGLSGDPGERTGTLLSLEDATGDGLPEVLVAQASEAIALCGIPRAPLFPRALDVRTGELRPVLLNRLRGLSGRETPLAARWESPGPSGPPITTVASFTAASTSTGDGADAMRVSPPLAIADGDTATTWAEGRGGNGAGEFVTAEIAGGIPVRAIAVVASPSGTAEAARARGRPTSLRLVVGGQRFHVTLPSDPAEHPGEPVWIALPAPVPASCVSVVLDGAIEPPARRGVHPPVEIAEVLVYTDLDFGGGTERLVAALSSPGTAGDDAARLLSRAGDRGAQAVAAALPGLSGRPRALAARILADHHGAIAVPPLVGLLGDDDERVGAEAVRGLTIAGSAAVAPLVAAVSSGSGTTLARAAEARGRIGGTEALAALVGRAGTGGGSERRAVRDAITFAAAGLADRAVPVLSEALVGASDAGAAARRMDLARALDPTVPAFREIVARAVESAGGAAGFPERFHAVRLMGRLCEIGDARFVDTVARTAAEPATSAEQEILRAEAVAALGVCGAGGTGEILRALGDRAPRVRAAGIAAAGRAGLRGAAAKLARIARQDGWAFLRRGALEALATVAPEVRRPAIHAALQDRSADVRRSGVRLAIHFGVRAAADDLAARAADADEEAAVRTDAVVGLGQLCAVRHVAVVKRIARMGYRPDASDAEVAASAAAVEALGRLGGPIAAEEIRAAARESSPPALQMAAARARRGPRCEAAATPGRR